MPNKKVRAKPDIINYKQWFNSDLPALLTQVTRWLKKNDAIHIYDIVIDGAATYADDWQATIYYFADEEEGD